MEVLEGGCRICDVVKGADGVELIQAYIDSMAYGFQPPLLGFFYNVLDIFSVALMQLQPSC